MKTRIDGIKITGIASALPNKVVNVSAYNDIFGEKKVKRIKKSTGVKSMHIVDNGVTASDLCVDAAKKLFKQMNVNPQSIDGVLFVSFSPDYKAPATAFVLQSKLGVKNEAVAMDLNFGCSAYVYGLYQASMLIKAGGCKKVLLCTGDEQSQMVHQKDRAMKMLVGDAGTATLVEAGNDNFNFYFKSIGSNYDKLIIPAGGSRIPCSEKTKEEIVDEDGNIRTLENLYMNGMEVMKFALTEVPPAMESIYQQSGLRKEEIDLYAMHQPNKLILDYLMNSMEIAPDKMPVGLQETGNTGSASIPLLLTVLKTRGYDFNKAKKTIACGFGIGLSIGAVNIDLSKTSIVTIETGDRV